MASLEESIIFTLKFFEQVRYPIEKNNFYSLLIGKNNRHNSTKVFNHILEDLIHQKVIFELNGYLGLGKESLNGMVKERSVTEAASRAKYRYAKKSVAFLKNFGFIKFIGVTGSVAVGNAKDTDIINLIIISKAGFEKICFVVVRLWFGLTFRSKRFEIVTTIGEGGLAFHPRDLLSAWRVINIKPLINNVGV